MSALDFPNAQLPRLTPLARSYAQNGIEADLQRLLIDLFARHLAADVFDANVLGATHLGSYELVRRAVNSDGLILLAGNHEQAATRYLYRAWKSRNTQGRGLHFLRTYLEVLFPGIGSAKQLWHSKTQPYPSDLSESKRPGDFLTSRARVTVVGFPDADSDQKIMKSIAQVIPARIVPQLRYTGRGQSRKVVVVGAGMGTHTLFTTGKVRNELALQAATQMSVANVWKGTVMLLSSGSVK